MTTVFFDWSPVDEAVLNQVGTSMRRAVDQHVPVSDPDVDLFVQRRDDGNTTWRLVYKGPVPDRPQLSAVRFAAKVAGGWALATFIAQEDGGWSTLLEPGPVSTRSKAHG